MFIYFYICKKVYKIRNKPEAAQSISLVCSNLEIESIPKTETIFTSENLLNNQIQTILMIKSAKRFSSSWFEIVLIWFQFQE